MPTDIPVWEETDSLPTWEETEQIQEKPKESVSELREKQKAAGITGFLSNRASDLFDFLGGIEPILQGPAAIVETGEKGIEGIAHLTGLAKPESRLLWHPSETMRKSVSQALFGKNIPSIPKQESAPAQVAAGLGNVVVDLANFIQTPEAWVYFGLPKLPPAAQQAAATAIAGQMISQAPSQAKAGLKALREGDWQTAAKELGGALATTSMASGAGRLGMEPVTLPKVPKETPNAEVTPEPPEVQETIQQSSAVLPEAAKEAEKPPTGLATTPPSELFEKPAAPAAEVKGAPDAIPEQTPDAVHVRPAPGDSGAMGEGVRPTVQEAPGAQAKAPAEALTPSQMAEAVGGVKFDAEIDYKLPGKPPYWQFTLTTKGRQSTIYVPKGTTLEELRAKVAAKNAEYDAAEGKTAPKAKEPWQFSQEDYYRSGGGGMLHLGKGEVFELHKQSVERALREGKPVSEEVLSDYPDLKAAPPSVGPRGAEKPATSSTSAASSVTPVAGGERASSAAARQGEVGTGSATSQAGKAKTPSASERPKLSPGKSWGEDITIDEVRPGDVFHWMGNKRVAPHAGIVSKVTKANVIFEGGIKLRHDEMSGGDRYIGRGESVHKIVSPSEKAKGTEPPLPEGPGALTKGTPPRPGVDLTVVPFPGVKQWIDQDLVPFAKDAVDTIRETGQQVRALVSPASMSKESGLAAGTIREHRATLAQTDVQMREKFHKAMKEFDKLGPRGSLDFIDRMETGTAQPTPELQSLSAELRNQFDDRVAKVRALGTGKLQQVITDYFPHIWKDKDAAMSWYARIFSRRPLRGPATFLKHRSIPTTADGIAAGLEPVSYNPIELSLLKLHEIDRYIMGQKIFQELKDKGLAKFSRSGMAPDGFAPINDRIAEVVEYRPTVTRAGTPGAPERILRGKWYAQEDAARVLNNFLSPGLERFKWYRAMRWVGNTLNMAQLGLSGYHGMFTMIDAGTSKLSLGIEQAAQGKPKGLLTMGRGLAGTLAANQMEAYYKGSKVLKEYTKPGSVGGDYAKVVDALIASGGRTEMPKIFKNSSLENFFRAVRTGNTPGALLRAPFAAIEAVSYPLMQNIVPRLKLGVFNDMALHEIQRLGPNVPRDEFRRQMGKIWDSVDNRMGELVYDNLFWNRTLKDLSFLMVRAVGWNLGTIRELGGGALDAATFWKRIGTNDPILTKRMAYTMALPFTVGLMGAMYQYMKTGQPPEELRDYFYPRTGKTLPDGTVERVNFPSYLKDIVSYRMHPLTTLGHKLHPMWSQMVDMLNNKDFYGTQIRNPDDPIVQQVGQLAKFVAGSYVPFSVKGATRRVGAKESLGIKAESFLGIMPISPELARTKAQNKIMEYSLKSLPAGARTPEEQQRHEYTKEIMDATMSPQDAAEARRKFIELQRQGKLTRGQQIYQQNKVRFLQDQLTRGRTKAEAQWLWRFNHLNVDEAQHVYDLATPEEKKLFERSLLLKIRKGPQVTP